MHFNEMVFPNIQKGISLSSLKLHSFAPKSAFESQQTFGLNYIAQNIPNIPKSNTPTQQRQTGPRLLYKKIQHSP
jgi:hypothetical protein